MSDRLAPNTSRIERPRVSILLVGLIALKTALLFVFAWHTRFVMDEFGQLGYAKYLGHELFDTLWPAKAVGFQIFIKLAHMIGWDAVSILLIGRIQTALLGCAVLVMIFACARALNESPLRALGITLLLLSFSNFIERIFRTIAEPLAVFFAVASLLVILRGHANRARTVVIAGALAGLSFLATQKSVYFDLALGFALVGDAFLARQFRTGLIRGLWLVCGWLVPIGAYCIIFGGSEPMSVVNGLVFGPAEVASSGIAAEYGGLRGYVVQTLFLNWILYAFCLAGMALELRRIRELQSARRIALIFSIVITLLVFAHNQPWPYVFIMAQPFMSLWALVPIDRAASDPKYSRLALLALSTGVAISLIRNVQYLQFGNEDQLSLIQRAESALVPGDVYFDGIGMLPNRSEPSTLWLDRHYVLKTMREKRNSEAYRIFAEHPPKAVIWSYRMDSIKPAIGQFIRDSYVQISPNLRVAGRRLLRDQTAAFDVPYPGRYALYSDAGDPVQGQVEVDGVTLASPMQLQRGRKGVTLRSGPGRVLLLPEGSYTRSIRPGADNRSLFNDVYS